MAEVKANFSLTFGYPNAGISLRWGETWAEMAYAAGSTHLIEHPADIWKVRLFWEVIVGNMADVGRSTQLQWQAEGRTITTSVNIPSKPSVSSGVTLSERVTLPDGAVVLRTASHPQVGVGEVGIWIPIGMYGPGNSGSFSVQSVVGGQSLTRDIVIGVSGPSTLGNTVAYGTRFVESARSTTTTQYGAQNVTWPNRIVVSNPENHNQSLNFTFSSPLFPESNDRLGAGFKKRAVFKQISREEGEFDLHKGISAKFDKNIVLVSEDGSVEFQFNFLSPKIN